MIMIPLPFIVSMIAIYFLVSEYLRKEEKKPNVFWMLFLAAVAIQAVLTGARFGYDLEFLRKVQSTFAVIVPPLAYLSFARTTRTKTILFLTLPFVCYFLAYQLNLNFIDLVLSVNNLFFLAGLLWIAFNVSTCLSWVGISNLRQAVMALWTAILFLTISASIDTLIVWDYWQNQGVNLQNIVASASVIGLLFSLPIIGYIFLGSRKNSTKTAERDKEHEVVTFKKIEQLMKQEKLYLDPDLNLNRIARKLTLPVRDVSRAINGQANLNVSQYINGLRISESCRLMQKSKISIIEALYASGFNTKSNFNREFIRITGNTPSAWRENLIAGK